MTHPYEQSSTDNSISQGQLTEDIDLLRAIVSGTTDAVYAKDREGRYILFNEGAERISGKRAADVLGRDDMSIFSPTDARAIMSKDQLVMTSGTTMDFEDTFISSTGEQRFFLATKGPVFDEH